MNRLSLAPLLLLAACSKPAEPALEPSNEASAAASSDAASRATAEPDAAASDTPGPVSQYTRFKDCELIAEGRGEDWSTSACKGLGGYDLRIEYGDARDELVLVRAGRPPARLGLFQLGGGGFNTLGDTAEWRGAGQGRSFTPSALIVRNKLSEDPEDSARQTAYLLVIDLAKGCIAAQVPPGSDQNEAARGIADKLPGTCKVPAKAQ